MREIVSEIGRTVVVLVHMRELFHWHAAVGRAAAWEKWGNCERIVTIYANQLISYAPYNTTKAHSVRCDGVGSSHSIFFRWQRRKQSESLVVQGRARFCGEAWWTSESPSPSVSKISEYPVALPNSVFRPLRRESLRLTSGFNVQRSTPWLWYVPVVV